MSVYRGRSRCKIKALLNDWHEVGDRESTPQVMRACIDGAKALALIMQDLRVQLGLRTTIDPGTARDATDLITAASFFHFGPLMGMLWAIEKKPMSPEIQKHSNSYRNNMGDLSRAIYDAQRKLNNLQTNKTTRIAEDLKMISLSPTRSATEHVAIPLLSPIELLMRIVTARRTWNRLGMVSEA